jgi:hypothetical protein
VVLYRTEDGRTALDVRLAGETVWLTQAQMVDLFGRERSVITKHVRNVFSDGELKEKGNVQKMHIPNSDKPVALYSLDVIISVGYRVKSKRGTQFRIWATRTLKDHLIHGYTLNERRLREQGLADAEQAIQLLSRTLTRRNLVNDEGRGVLEVITRYAKSWLLLKEYDEERLAIPPCRKPARVTLDYSRARKAIEALKARLTERGEATPLFGQERNDQVAGIVGSIEQTFDGKPLYPQHRGEGGASPVLRDQGPPLCRRQQTHRLVPVHPVPARERLSRRRKRSDQDQRQRPRGARVAHRGERTAK